MAMTFGRFLTGALISAALAVGGVWYVVTNAIAGLQTAIDATNSNISNVQTSISEQIDLRFENLKLTLENQFGETRASIESAVYFEPSFVGENGEKFRIAFKASEPPVSELISSNSRWISWSEITGATLAETVPDTAVFAVASDDPSPDMWAQYASSADPNELQLLTGGLSSPSPLVQLGCFNRLVKFDGTPVLAPKPGKTIAGRDGIVCFAGFEEVINIPQR